MKIRVAKSSVVKGNSELKQSKHVLMPHNQFVSSTTGCSFFYSFELQTDISTITLPVELDQSRP